MKKTSTLLWGSISILIGAVIAVLALVRGKWQLPLLISCFALWGLWLIFALLLPAWRSNQRGAVPACVHAPAGLFHCGNSTVTGYESQACPQAAQGNVPGVPETL